MKKKNIERKRVASGGTLFSVLFGICAAIVMLLILLMLFSGVSLITENPHPLLTPLSFFSIYTSAFFGGFFATKKNKGRDPLLCGSLCGLGTTLILCLTFWAIGAIFDTESTLSSWIFRALGVVFSIVGALAAIKKSNTSPKKRRRKR